VRKRATLALVFIWALAWVACAPPLRGNDTAAPGPAPIPNFPISQFPDSPITYYIRPDGGSPEQCTVCWPNSTSVLESAAADVLFQPGHQPLEQNSPHWRA
jgi:hypothetical protein